MQENKHLQKIINYFQSKKEIIAVYLFGSYRKNKQSISSDIDIAVLVDFTKKIDNNPYLFEINQLVREIYIDVKVLNILPLFFQFNILKMGELIFLQNNKKRIEYETYIMSQYQDFKPYLDYYNKCMYKHIENNYYGHGL